MTKKKKVPMKRRAATKEPVGLMTVYFGQPTDAAGKQGWRWQLKSRNGRVLADSGEGYLRRAKAIEAAERLIDFDFEHVKLLALDKPAPVVELTPTPAVPTPAPVDLSTLSPRRQAEELAKIAASKVSSG